MRGPRHPNEMIRMREIDRVPRAPCFQHPPLEFIDEHRRRWFGIGNVPEPDRDTQNPLDLLNKERDRIKRQREDYESLSEMECERDRRLKREMERFEERQKRDREFMDRIMPDFKSAKKFGLGPGIAHKRDDSPLYERYRHDDHPPYGEHLNYEVILPLKKTKRTMLMSSFHILLEEEDDD